jgi:hypothetical protein
VFHPAACQIGTDRLSGVRQKNPVEMKLRETCLAGQSRDAERLVEMRINMRKNAVQSPLILDSGFSACPHREHSN